MTFYASDSKERNFLDLLDDNLNSIKLSSSKGSPWLSQFSHLNLLCTQASRAITNYTPIGEFQLKFFPRERFDYLCGFYSIETRLLWNTLNTNIFLFLLSIFLDFIFLFFSFSFFFY